MPPLRDAFGTTAQSSSNENDKVFQRLAAQPALREITAGIRQEANRQRDAMQKDQVKERPGRLLSEINRLSQPRKTLDLVPRGVVTSPSRAELDLRATKSVERLEAAELASINRCELGQYAPLVKALDRFEQIREGRPDPVANREPPHLHRLDTRRALSAEHSRQKTQLQDKLDQFHGTAELRQTLKGIEERRAQATGVKAVAYRLTGQAERDNTLESTTRMTLASAEQRIADEIGALTTTQRREQADSENQLAREEYRPAFAAASQPEGASQEEGQFSSAYMEAWDRIQAENLGRDVTPEQSTDIGDGRSL